MKKISLNLNKNKLEKFDKIKEKLGLLDKLEYLEIKVN